MDCVSAPLTAPVGKSRLEARMNCVSLRDGETVGTDLLAVEIDPDLPDVSSDKIHLTDAFDLAERRFNLILQELVELSGRQIARYTRLQYRNFVKREFLDHRGPMSRGRLRRMLLTLRCTSCNDWSTSAEYLYSRLITDSPSYE